MENYKPGWSNKAWDTALYESAKKKTWCIVFNDGSIFNCDDLETFDSMYEDWTVSRGEEGLSSPSDPVIIFYMGKLLDMKHFQWSWNEASSRRAHKEREALKQRREKRGEQK